MEPRASRLTLTTSALLTKGLTFVLGFGFALLPAYGPFIGLLLLFASRWRLRRSDLLWWGAALLLAIPLGVHSGAPGFLFGALQVLAPWLIYRAFARLHGTRLGLENSWVGVGLLSGLALVVALGWLQADGGSPATFAEAFVGEARGNLYGHTVFTLGALVALLLPKLRWQLLSLGLSAFGVLVSGSREAAIAWLVVAVALCFVGKTRAPRKRLAMGAAVGTILLFVALLGPLFGWGNVGFLLDVAPRTSESRNLLQGTEVANGDWWQPVGVHAEAHPVTLGDRSLTGYLLTKTDPESTSRLQQVVTLEANTPYTLSLWLRNGAGTATRRYVPQTDAQPGVQGWGQSLDEAQSFGLEGALTHGVWQAAVNGPGRVLDAGLLETRGAWRHVYATFVYEGASPRLDWWLGLAPDRRNRAGARVAFAGFQLESGVTATPYIPGAVTQGLSLQRTRLAYWQTAWRGFLGSPLWGQGEVFPRFFRATWPDFRQVSELPSHAHSLPLQFLYERGLLGFAGLLLFIGALSTSALRKGDAALLVVVAALLGANLFDTTLFSGQVLYPLAAVAGWRAAAYRYARVGERDSATRQFGVRLALVTMDFAAALLAFSVAIWTRQLAAVVFGLPPIDPLANSLEVARYALLLWPVMAWREGLYPGYGFTEPQELRKQVVSAAYAGLILAGGTVLFAIDLPIPRSILLLTILYSMVLTPVARALTKRLLHRAGAWGRAVVILGAGQAGARIARALGKRPLDGLHPVAFFDDDDAKQGQIVAGLRVRGRLTDADLYALRRGVQHAIVAIPTATPQLLTGLINHRGRIFRRVQFIPDLVNLPSEGVYASDLDGMLALEVRLGLYSRLNQGFKRAVDLFGSVVGGALISPVLLALALWVKLDSPGPIFYWSTRIGQKGQPFKCLKFRSMYEDADARLREMLLRDPAVRGEYERFHKLDKDPRITRAGSFIRRYSLDELTQLYNVVRGEMSLVGPRPYLVQELPDMRGLQEVILEAKPGMTGFWQVSGRSEVTFEERLEMESQYVRNWSPWWDLIILVQTVTVVLARRGAR